MEKFPIIMTEQDVMVRKKIRENHIMLDSSPWLDERIT